MTFLLNFLFSSILLVFLLFLASSLNANVHVVKVRTTETTEGVHKARRAVCELPLSIGNCTRKFARFYWDNSLGHCYKFFYSGCGGNGNRFLSRHQCKKRCSPKFQHKRKHKKTKITAKLSTVQQKENVREKEINNKCSPQNCKGGTCIKDKCQCQKGFELVAGECIDINECHWAKCADLHAECLNLAGTFQCQCPSGYAGSGLNCTKERSICAQWFDHRYERHCGKFTDGNWQPRWHFHLHSGQCRQFWYGGCQFAESQNIFPDKKSCESICAGYSHEEFFADQLSKTNQIMDDPNGHSNGAAAITMIANNGIAADGTNRSSPCADPFDASLRHPCSDGIWKRRYFFDSAISRCRVFWMDASCPRVKVKRSNQRPSSEKGHKSRNLFAKLSSCKKRCEREEEIEADLGVDEWQRRQNGMASGVIQASFSLDRTGKKDNAEGMGRKDDCKETALANQMWAKKREKLAKIKAKMKEAAKREKIGMRMRGKMATECLEEFDWNLIKSCRKSPWKKEYYFDKKNGKCRPFWNNGCPGKTRNRFENEKKCQWKCEEAERRGEGEGGNQMGEGNPLEWACAEEFDDNYRRACQNGAGWRRKWFFDQKSGVCRYFWYDGCKGRSRNIFDGLKECMDLCQLVEKEEEEEVEEGKDNFINKDYDSPHSTAGPTPFRTTPKLAYFGSNEVGETAELKGADGVEESMGFWAFHKNYLQSEQLNLDETECTAIRYNATNGKARLRAFFCLLEEGGGCQIQLLLADKSDDGEQKCHQMRPWLRGKHKYAWFFTLERNGPNANDESGIRPAATGLLNLRQSALNLINSTMIRIEPFGRQNETVAWVDLLQTTSTNCHEIC